MSTAAEKSQQPTITSLTDLPIDQAKFLTLKKIEFIDANGEPRAWEVAQRKTTASSGVDAVAIGNILLSDNARPQTLLAIQYRPPLDAFCVEWPAGLIDDKETVEQAAIREFKEETGLDVSRVLDADPEDKERPIQSADPGMSSATMKLVMVEAKMPADGQLPPQKLDAGEIIERKLVPLEDLYEVLLEYSHKERHMVAGKLMHFAQGMDFMKKQKYF